MALEDSAITDVPAGTDLPLARCCTVLLTIQTRTLDGVPQRGLYIPGNGTGPAGARSSPAPYNGTIH